MTRSTGSVYPPSVADLLPRVRERMDELGRLPSRNQVMSEFNVGAPKAKAILAALAAPDPGPADDGRREGDVTESPPVRALRSVPATGPDTDQPAETDPGPTDGDDTPSADGGSQVAPVVDPGPSAVATVDEPVVTDAIRMEPSPSAPAESVTAADPATTPDVPRRDPVRRWPLALLALPAFVAIWGGWVGLGRMTGFGPVQLLPGIWDELVINSAITLPIGMEAYAAFAMSVWLSSRAYPDRTRRFAMWSALGSLTLGMAGQVAYHLMSAAGFTVAPWVITTFVACLPVVVLGCGAALLHLMHEETSA